MRTWLPAALGALVLCSCASSESCPSGFFECSGRCVDLMGDVHNCEACGTTCAEGQVCSGGICMLSCPDGYTECGGVCRDLGSDIYNCGMCGMSCSSGFVCAEGACVPDCPDGYSDCEGTCRNLDSDPSNCGSCGNVCADGEVCSSGTCSFSCPAPYADCSGACADLSTDHLHCGACDSPCAGGEICVGGACTVSCYLGLTLCSGVCVDLMRDPDNCGACGSGCASGEFCYDGSCTASCPGGFTDCSGVCRDLSSDRLNCGACDSPCVDGEVCESSTCTLLCVSPLVVCSGVCTDTSYDPRNCGSCGAACSSTEACVSGTCEGLVSRNVLVYYDSFTTTNEPASLATTRMGWTLTATNTGTAFASAYDAGGWAVVVIDVPGSSLPTEVHTRVLDRISTGGRLIFSWWDLDTDATLATALGVSTVSYNTPHNIYPTSGASVNFFTTGESVPVPLTGTDEAGDNGDYLTLTGGGEIVFSADSATGTALGAITNSGATIVLGFLPWDYKATDNDSDGVGDMTELFMNMLRY